MNFKRSLLLCVAFSPLLCGEIHVLAVTTSAGFVNGLPGRGSLATIFCTGLTGITGIQAASGTPLPRVLADIRVTQGTQDAPLLAVADLGAFQIVSFQVPWENNTGPFVISQASSSALLPAQSAPWGQLFVDPFGDAYALHVPGYRPVTPADPARPGQWIMLLGTNFGDVLSPPATGSPAAAQPLSYLDPGSPIWSFAVFLNQPDHSVSLESNYFGLAPGTVGVYQFNVHMPESLAAGTASLYVQRSRFCGFFFNPACGKGEMIDVSTRAGLPVSPGP